MHPAILSTRTVVLWGLFACIAGTLAFSAWVLLPVLRQYHAEVVLKQALKDSNDVVAAGIIAELEESRGAEHVVRLLTEMVLGNGDDKQNAVVRANSVRALGEIGSQRQLAVPTLIGAMNDKDVIVRRHAINILGLFGSESKNAVPSIVDALRNDPNVRANAAEALGTIGADDEIRLRALKEALQDNDDQVRILSAFSIWRIARDGRLAVPVLLDALASENDDVQSLAIGCLERIGPEAGSALPKLQELEETSKRDVIRWRAARAIKRIGG